MKTLGTFGTTSKQKLTRTVGLSAIILTSIVLSTALAAAQNPDLTITANPPTLCVNPGINGSSAISIASTGGFSGTVNLGASISPILSGGPALSSIPSSVNLSEGETIPLTLGISTTQSTPTYVYTITIAGLSGQTYRSASFSLVVSTDCSVGGVVVSSSGLTSTSRSLGLGIAIAALVGVVATGLAFYARRNRDLAGPRAVN